MASRSSMLHVRVDDDIKEKAATALGAMGLSMTDAVRLLLHRVVADQAFPLELKVPNAATRAAMAEAEEIAQRRNGRAGSVGFATADELFAGLEAHRGK